MAERIREAGLPVRYEVPASRISYTIPARQTRYTPDFLLPNGIALEIKGRFTAADRKKHLLIQREHPHLDIRFVFQNANNKLYKGSKTTYAAWCEKHGFEFAHRDIPDEWLN